MFQGKSVSTYLYVTHTDSKAIVSADLPFWLLEVVYQMFTNWIINTHASYTLNPNEPSSMKIHSRYHDLTTQLNLAMTEHGIDQDFLEYIITCTPKGTQAKVL